jgi:UDP-N-acetylglucosamine 2-epimerase (non-hydrolysing)
LKSKILIVFGTRPEAIKLIPVIKQFQKEPVFKIKTCSTGQHKEMLNQVMDIFQTDFNLDFDLSLMEKNQTLFDLTVKSLSSLKSILNEAQPDLVLVQGDTTTAFTTSLAAFYNKIDVGHVEAGLRSYNNFSPYPEEVNRKFISVLSSLNFAPTIDAKNNLLKEGIDEDKIFVTGNTVIDALMEIKSNYIDGNNENLLDKILPDKFFDKPFVLITMHRREKFGTMLAEILDLLKYLSIENPDLNFVYPVHLNPNVKAPVEKILKNLPNFFLIPPLDYVKFLYLMSKCLFIMSDSGGVQEECYVFRKPIMVLRDVTERNEAIKSGYAFLTGSSRENNLIKFHELKNKLSTGSFNFPPENPFGDGNAAKKIVDIIKQKSST